MASPRVAREEKDVYSGSHRVKPPTDPLRHPWPVSLEIPIPNTAPASFQGARDRIQWTAEVTLHRVGFLGVWTCATFEVV
ncbi:MAG: hypothetical protein AB1758_12595 [Candidatus Eremiobacterota bacterium]